MEIIHSENNVIILDKESKRKFIVNLDKKIPIYGFGKLNQKKVLLDKLILNDYIYEINTTNLFIEFGLINGTRKCTYKLECEEIFPEADINENIENVTIEDLKKIIVSLRNKVSNLTQKLENKESDFEFYKDQMNIKINYMK